MFCGAASILAEPPARDPRLSDATRALLVQGTLYLNNSLYAMHQLYPEQPQACHRPEVVQRAWDVWGHHSTTMFCRAARPQQQLLFAQPVPSNLAEEIRDMYWRWLEQDIAPGTNTP